MNNVTTDAVAKLRKATSLPMMACKKALKETAGDVDKAIDVLRERGERIVDTRADVSLATGRIETFVHFTGRLASMVEVHCQTDFLAGSDDFRTFCRDLAIHVCGVPFVFITMSEAAMDGWADGIDEDEVLLKQKFVRDESKTIEDLLNELVCRSGEKIVIAKASRWQL